MIYNEDRTRVYYSKNTFSLFMVFFTSRFDKLVLSKFDRGKKAKFDLDIKQQLYDYYASDIASLEKLLGWNLESWKSPKVI